jgi:hypothetical protein
MSGGASLVCLGSTFFRFVPIAQLVFYCLYKVFSFYKLDEAKCLEMWGQMHIWKRYIPACMYM